MRIRGYSFIQLFINYTNQGLKMYFLPDRAFISIEKMLCLVFFPVGDTQK
jgi:hypothetical protein